MTPTPHPPPPFYGRPSREIQPRLGPLAGIRVADFTWMAMGSVASRILADFGAECIKIEDRTHRDMPRVFPMYKDGGVRAGGERLADADPNKGGVFNNICRNKLAITLNLRTERGRELAEQLISHSSVVAENFAPDVMERWGLTYQRMTELVPDIIYARMSGYGHSGPHYQHRSFGPIMQANAGLMSIAGLPGREPSGWGFAYMDYLGAYYSAAAILMAVWNRRRTGQGTEIDMAGVEAAVGLIGPVFLDITVNQHSTLRPDYPTGNRLEYPDAAPHGVYPCRGEDRWVAIAVFDDADWEAFVKALDDPHWAADERFSSQASRFAHQDELDAHVAAWTTDKDHQWVMSHLQSHGVSAGAVQHSGDLNEVDPQLAHRGAFFEMDHPVIGVARFEDFPARMSGKGLDHWRSAPLVGEDNDYVYGEILGLDPDEREKLTHEGVI